MRRLLAMFALIGLGASAPALADVTLRYRPVFLQGAPPEEARANGPTMTIDADDAGHARIEMAAPPGAGGLPGGRAPGFALITRDGVGYISSTGSQPGQELVARQDDAFALLTPMATGLAAGSGREGVREMMLQRVEIVAAGTETVAGVPGQIYRLVLITGDTRSPPLEIVVSADPRLAPAGRELLRFTEAVRPIVVAVAGGEPQLYGAILTMLGHGTPLRIANAIVLDSFSTDDVPDSRFALPGPVLSREQLGQIMGAMMGGRPPAAGSAPAGATPPTPQ